MGGLFGNHEKTKCCCGNCTTSCCPGVTIEDGFATYVDSEPGALGCPDNPAVFVDAQLLLGDGADYVDVFGEDVPCTVFESINDIEIPGLLGSTSFDVVVGCVNSGGQFKAFIRYTNLTAPTGLPNGEWIEVPSGFECPDCESNPDTFFNVPMWFEVPVNCTVCNSSDYQYAPFEGCNPDDLYSIRLNWTIGMRCNS
jgi:hypothetical protein